MSSDSYNWKTCAIPNCGVSRSDRFHKFPSKDLDTRKKWMDKCGLNKVNSSSRICSEHFTPNDYVKTKLKQGAIPSQNLPVRHFLLYIKHSV